MLNFDKNRKYIENEFERACFDTATGKSHTEIFEKLQEIQESKTEEPRQIVVANAYAYLLENVQLEINPHTPFSVKLNIGIDYSGFASLDIFDTALFRTQRKKILSEKFPEEYEKMKNDNFSFGTYTDFWHTVPNWNRILGLGFAGILKEAELQKEKLLKSQCYEVHQHPRGTHLI